MPATSEDALARIEARLARVEAALDRVTALLEPLPGALAMATDSADELAQAAARRGVDLDARVQAALAVIERVSEPKTLAALGRLAERAERLEPVVTLAAGFEDHLALAVDTFDAEANRLVADGIDVDARVETTRQLALRFTDPRVSAVLMRASEPQTLRILERVIDRTREFETLVDLAGGFEDHLGMVVDTFDAWAAELGRDGHDLESRLQLATDLFRTLTDPELARAGRSLTERLPQLAAILEQLDRSGLTDPERLRLLGDLSAAVPEALAARPAPVGVFGAFGAMFQPDLQRALGLGLEIARRVSARLPTP